MLFCISCSLGLAPAALGESPSEMAAALIEKERVRSVVERAFAHMQRQVSDPGIRNQHFHEAIEQLVELGQPAVPYLIDELEQERYDTFRFCAIALGWLNTPEAEAALRRAVTQAMETDGDNALSRKGIAAYALGLMGEVEAL